MIIVLQKKTERDALCILMKQFGAVMLNLFQHLYCTMNGQMLKQVQHDEASANGSSAFDLCIAHYFSA